MFMNRMLKIKKASKSVPIANVFGID